MSIYGRVWDQRKQKTQESLIRFPGKSLNLLWRMWQHWVAPLHELSSKLSAPCSCWASRTGGQCRGFSYRAGMACCLELGSAQTSPVLPCVITTMLEVQSVCLWELDSWPQSSVDNLHQLFQLYLLVCQIYFISCCCLFTMGLNVWEMGNTESKVKDHEGYLKCDLLTTQ